MENGMQMTLEGCMPETFQKQIAGASDFHVRTSPLQENSLDFKGTVQACFSELCTLSDNSKKKIDPLTRGFVLQDVIEEFYDLMIEKVLNYIGAE